MKKKMTRRDFLKETLTLSACACCSAALGPMKANDVYAMSAQGNGRAAVFLNQFGGNDPLNSFTVPYTVSAYYDRRPSLSISPGQVLTMAKGIGLNPVLDNMHDLYQDGDVAIIQGIGDPEGTRSHFTSQEIFSRGITNSSSSTDRRGWIGRLGDEYYQNVEFNTLGLGVGLQSDFTATRPTNRPLVTSRVANFGFDDDWYAGSNDNRYRRQIRESIIGVSSGGSDREKAARRSQKAMFQSVSTMQDVNSDYSSVVSYPNTTVGRYFIDAAKVIQYGLGTKIMYGGRGGWDSHSNQATGQDANLTQIDDALGAFAQDLKNMGKWNKTVICIFTEFGRNTFENASGGTDHGWGGAMVLIGGGVKGGVYGSTPTDNEIRNKRWLYMDIDFRNVFAKTIKWLGQNPDSVFPEDYQKVNLNLFT